MVGTFPRIVVLGIVPVFMVSFLLLKTPFMTQFVQSVSVRWVLVLCALRVPIEMGLIALARQNAYAAPLSGMGLSSEIVVGMLCMGWLVIYRQTDVPVSARSFYFLNRLGQVSVVWIYVVAILGPHFGSIPIGADDAQWITQFPFTWLFTLYYPMMWLFHGMLLKRAASTTA